MRRLPRHAWLLLVFLCGSDYCLAQTFDPPPAAIEYNKSAWKEFSSDEGRFTVSMPGKPTLTTREEVVGELKIPHSIHKLSTGTAAYIVSYGDLPHSTEDPAAIKRILDGGRDNALAQNPSNKLLSEKDIALDGHIGREWFVSASPYVFKARAYYVKGRLYQLVVGAPMNVVFNNGQPSTDPRDRTDFYEMLSSRFLDSFKLTATQGKRGEVERYLDREKVYDKDRPDPAGGVSDAGVLQGKALSLPKPPYPRAAIPERASGSVTVRVVVDEKGKVVAAQALDGHRLLQAAAVKAAREARFAPTLLGGKPVKIVGTITYGFTVK